MTAGPGKGGTDRSRVGQGQKQAVLMWVCWNQVRDVSHPTFQLCSAAPVKDRMSNGLL